MKLEFRGDPFGSAGVRPEDAGAREMSSRIPELQHREGSPTRASGRPKQYPPFPRLEREFFALEAG